MSAAIAIIITTYNREQYLGAAIESVLAQTRRDFELIIWDDGSTDRSLEIANDYAQHYQRVRVVAAKHLGRVPALKAALAETTSEYVGLVDSDDLLANTALEETAAVLDREPNVGLVYTDYWDIDQNDKLIGYGKRCQIPYSKERLLLDFMTFHFRLIRRSVLEQVGGIDESVDNVEDYDLCLRLSEVTEFTHICKPLYYYRNHSESLTQQRQLQFIQHSHQVMQRSLIRRGLSNCFEIAVQIHRLNGQLQGYFSLQTKRKQDLRSQFVGRGGFSRSIRHLAENLESKTAPTTLVFSCVCVSPGKKRESLHLFTSSWRQKAAVFLATIPLLGTIGVQGVQAQPIAPAPDGTNTIVTPNGDRIDITGGQTSRDGGNLFHSFTQFNVEPGNIANFTSLPEIRNILGRVVGGDASLINGLIQITGSNANLFLMNPAGIIFGPNAQLNVPAAFFATTANGIGFGNNWFNAIGTNNYADLVGAPSSFAFTMSQPGSIINSGNLSVGTGQTLTLLGGTVINTGQLSASQGNVTLTAVPGQSLVRLSQSGFVLSLDMQSPTASSTLPTDWTLPILSLPQLLTGGSGGNATGVTVNSDGSVQLVGSGIQIPTAGRTAIASGTLDASGQTGGTVQVLGDKVGVISANLNASGTNGGGTVIIGGDYQGKGTVPNASRTFVSSDSVISVDSFTAGNGGSIIVWANETTGFYGNISARGGVNSGNGGFVEISGKENLVFQGTVDLSAANGSTGTLLLDPLNIIIVDGGGGANDAEVTKDGQILFGDTPGATFTISETALEGLAAGTNVILEATNDITINDLADNELTFAVGPGGAITFTAGGNFLMLDNADTIRAASREVNISAGGNVTVGEISTFAFIVGNDGGDINITATNGGITAKLLEARSNQDGNGGAIALNAAGNILVTASIFSLAVFGDGNGGDIAINSSNGGINLNRVNSRTENGVAGDIAIQAANDIVIDDVANAPLNTSASANGTGGNISITSKDGIINIPSGIDSNSTGGDAGAIALQAVGNITTGNISSTGLLAGGNISLNSSGGTIDTKAGSLNSSSNSGNAGNIVISANGDITTGTKGAFGIISTSQGAGTNGGNISLTSNTGAIDTSAGIIDASTFGGGTAGTITLKAQNNITTNDLYAYGLSTTTGSGNNIFLSSTAGTINIGDLNSTAGNVLISKGGEIRLEAAGDITINRQVRSFANGTGTGGDIIIISKGGFIDTKAAPLQSGLANGSGGAIILEAAGDITTSNISSVGILGEDISLKSSGGAINTVAGALNSNSAGDAGGDIALSAPISITTGNINSSGSPGSGNISLKSNEINLTGGTNSVKGTGTLLLEPITSAQNIAIAGAADSGTDTLDLTTGDLNALQDGFTLITIGRTDGSGAIAIAGNVTFNDPVIIQTPVGGGSITSTGGTITTALGTSIDLIAGSNITSGNITAPGGKITLTSNSGAINTSAGTLNSSEAGNGGALAQLSAGIALNAPNGNISTGAINSSSISTGNAGTVTLNAGSGNITLGGDINASAVAGSGSNLSLAGNVTLSQPSITLTTSGNAGSGIITFNQSLNGTTAGSNSLTLNAGTGDVTFKAAVGDGTELGDLTVNTTGNTQFSGFVKSKSVTTNAGGTTQLNGDVTTSGAVGQTYGDPVTIIGGSASLIGDEISFAGNVSGTGKLTLQPFTSSQAIALGGTSDGGTNTLDLTASDLNALQDGFSAIVIGAVNGSNTITIAGDFTFKDPLTIQSPTGAGSITGTGSITGSGNASITLLANQNITTGSITAPAGITITSKSGAIDTSAGTLDSSASGDGGALAQLSAGIALSAPISITVAGINSTGSPNTGNISLTSNSINFAGTAGSVRGKGTLLLQPFTASQDLQLSGTNLAPLQDGFSLITIGRIDGSGAIALSSPITFSDPFIIQSPFGSLKINGAITGTDNTSIILLGNTVNLNADLTTDGQNITITGQVSLGNNVTISTGLVGGGNISFSDAIDGNFDLTLLAGSGDITLNSAVGSNTRLGDLTINTVNNFTAGDITAASMTQLSGSGTTRLGALNTNTPQGIILEGSAFILNGSVTTTNNGGFQIANNNPLTITANTPFNLDGSFSQTGSGDVSLAGNINTTDDEIRFNAPVLITGTVSLNPGKGGIAFNSSLTAGNNPLTLKAGEIDFGGPVTGTNTLFLQPITPEQNIIIGGTIDSGTETLDLTASDITALQDGFNTIFIGRSDGSGLIAIPNDVTFKDPVSIQTPTGSGAITADGSIIGLGDTSVTLFANNNITVRNITAPGGITLQSRTGAIESGNLDTSGITQGGDITVMSPLQIIAGQINSSASIGDGGDVSLDPQGDIQVEFINAQGGTNGKGGNVNIITQQFFRALGSFTDRNGVLASISTAGGTVGGNITLQHGGNGNIPFVVGDATSNGTAGAITSGANNTIAPTQSFRGSLVQGNIQLVTNAPPNQLPIANADSAETDQNTSVNTNVLSNDTDPDSDPLSVTGVSQGNSGTVTLNPDGTITYTPNPGFTGTDSFTYTIRDSEGGIATATVTVNVRFPDVPNQPPIANSDSAETQQNTSVSTNVLSNDTDPNNDPLSITGVSQGNSGTVTLNPDGTIIYTPNPGFTGPDSFTYTISDGKGGIATATVTINVPFVPPNQSPIANNDSAMTDQNTSIVTNVLSNDIDPDSDPFSIIGINQPTNGRVLINADGTITYSPNLDFTGIDSFTYTISDGKGGIATATVTINVPFVPIVPPNQAPIANSDTATTRRNVPVTVNLLANDIDPDSDPLTVVEFSEATNGAIALNPDGTITYTPNLNFTGSDRFIYTISDGKGNPVSSTVNVTVNALRQLEETSIATDFQGVTLSLTQIDNPGETSRVSVDTTSILRDQIAQQLTSGKLNEAVPQIEQLRANEFQNYFGGNLLDSPVQEGRSENITQPVTIEYVQNILSNIANQTGKTPAIIYTFVQAEQLQIILITPQGKSVLRTVPQANRVALLKEINTYRSEITDPSKVDTTSYLPAAQKLYQWLIAPLEAELQSRGIDTLAFSMDVGLRSLPLAALHDGKQFLVEKYNIGLIPSVNLVDNRYQDVKNSQVLAMGASRFDNFNPLPAVPIELSTITQEIWQGKSFINESFTINNLKSQRSSTPFAIVHLATHAEFKPGQPSNSFIQLWNEQLRLDRLRQMKLNSPLVELLVLSACRTALGDEQAELGFGGLAVAAGVKSALASLWYVSDEGTLALMTKFYEQLKTAPIKAEALRQAQISILKGEVHIEGGRLHGLRSTGEGVPLPSELNSVENHNLSHPYYWAAFIMIGSPW